MALFDLLKPIINFAKTTRKWLISKQLAQEVSYLQHLQLVSYDWFLKISKKITYSLAVIIALFLIINNSYAVDLDKPARVSTPINSGNLYPDEPWKGTKYQSGRSGPCQYCGHS